jgi:tetratricopeptide (TPR) repeat protein
MDSAERNLRDACEASDVNTSAYRNLGNYLLAQERWAEAEVAYRKSDAINRDANSVNLIAICLAAQEKFDEAEKLYRLAIELATYPYDGDERVFCGNLGLLFFEQERYEEAVTAFEMAIVAWSHNDETEVEYYMYRKASCLVELGRVGEAEIELQRTLSGLQSNEEEMGIISDETAGLVFNLLGVIRADHDSRPIDALAMYGEALRRTPNNPIFWSNRAMTEKNLGWKGAAEYSLGEAIRLNPRNDSYRERLEDL